MLNRICKNRDQAKTPDAKLFCTISKFTFSNRIDAGKRSSRRALWSESGLFWQYVGKRILYKWIVRFNVFNAVGLG